MLWSPNKIQGMGMVFSVSGDTDGHWFRIPLPSLGAFPRRVSMSTTTTLTTRTTALGFSGNPVVIPVG
jgi:hypothetical protein